MIEPEVQAAQDYERERLKFDPDQQLFHITVRTPGFQRQTMLVDEVTFHLPNGERKVLTKKDIAAGHFGERPSVRDSIAPKG